MPERIKANIFVAENEDPLREAIKTCLEGIGHKVVLEARSYVEARNAVGQFVEREVLVAVIDGNFTLGAFTGEEGCELAKFIRKQAPGVRIIGFSNGKIAGVRTLDKIHIDRLGRVVSGLHF